MSPETLRGETWTRARGRRPGGPWSAPSHSAAHHSRRGDARERQGFTSLGNVRFGCAQEERPVSSPGDTGPRHSTRAPGASRTARVVGTALPEVAPSPARGGRRGEN